MDWWVQRVASSERYATNPHEVRYVWSYADLVEAHLVLDALDDVQALYRPDPPKKTRTRR